MKKAFLLAGTILFSSATFADNYELPLELALKAANNAVSFCQSEGYYVTAAVVDMHGETKVLLKGDGSTVHTKDTAFRKAYTLVTLGPVFNYSTSSEAAKAFSGKPSEVAFHAIPNIALLPGAVIVKARGGMVAAVGVGGAPGGDKDEACAAHGVETIAEELRQ